MLTFWEILILVVVVVTLIEGLFIVAILRLVGHLHLQLEAFTGQDIDRQDARAPIRHIPDRTMETLSGGSVQLSHLWHDRQAMFLFTSTGCPLCSVALKRFADVLSAPGQRIVNACVLCAGEPDVVHHMMVTAGISATIPVVVVDAETLGRDFSVQQTPTLVTIDAPGHIRDVISGLGVDEHLRQYTSPSALTATVVAS